LWSSNTSAEQFGNMQFTVPPGWKVDSQTKGMYLSPPDLASNDESALLGVMANEPLTGDLRAWFDARVQRLAAKRTVVSGGEVRSRQASKGHTVLSTTLELRDANGRGSFWLIVAANPNNRAESYLFSTSSQKLFDRYMPQVQAFGNSIKFIQTQQQAAAATPTAQEPWTTKPPASAPAIAAQGAPSPVPASAVQGVDLSKIKDPKDLAKARANLNPPPPSGGTRLDGLYATQDSGGHVGPGGAFFVDVVWRFRYFMPNGYVYLGNMQADLDNTRCTQPTVNEYGGPICTTYAIDNGRIRIGLNQETRFARSGEDVKIGDYTYVRIPKQDNLRLNGTYSYFSAGVAAANSADFKFTSDGRFEADRGIFINYNSDPSGVRDPVRTSVTGVKQSGSKGTYRINGYTLELTSEDGRKQRMFFGRLSTQILRIGTQEYVGK
jgi:hypothetical protein